MKLIKLTNTTGHNKFWTAEAIGAKRVLTTWGRIGTIGQSKVFHFDFASGVREYLVSKLSEKLGRGYDIVKIA